MPADALPDLVGRRVLLATHGDSTSLDLQPWESRIYLPRLSRSSASRRAAPSPGVGWRFSARAGP